MAEAFSIPIPVSVWIVLALITVVVAVVLLLSILPIITFRITVSRDTIEASSLIMYSVTVKREDVESISIIDLSKHPELKPTLRTFGTGLPGYGLGWFKLANGAKAFLAVSTNKAVVIRLNDGTYVILTPKNMDEFIHTLNKYGGIT